MPIPDHAQKAKQIFWFCGVCIAMVAISCTVTGKDKPMFTAGVTNTAASSSNSLQKSATDGSNLPTLEVARSVMVTVELDFGPRTTNIADALQEIERRYDPDDGLGRTFAIIEAYGEPTTDGKLHISMHVSAEKPGLGALVFRRTGESLWKTRIVRATHPPASSFAGKGMFIMLDNEEGKSFLLDGSKGANSILDVVIRDTGMPVLDFWPDAAERPVTFFYSACGCPVKVLARRVRDKTVRTKELPVIFPDDPEVVATISRLMGWDSL